MDGYGMMLLGVKRAVLLSTSRLSRRKVLTMIQKTSHLQIHLFIDKNYIKAAEERLKSGRARGATIQGIFSSLIAAILVSGCAAAYAPAPLPANHPANPAAPEAPHPPPSQAFRRKSTPPAPTEEAPTRGSHSGHDMKHGGH